MATADIITISVGANDVLPKLDQSLLGINPGSLTEEKLKELQEAVESAVKAAELAGIDAAGSIIATNGLVTSAMNDAKSVQEAVNAAIELIKPLIPRR